MKRRTSSIGPGTFLWVRLTCCWLDSVDRRRVIMNLFYVHVRLSLRAPPFDTSLLVWPTRCRECVPRQARFLTLVDSKARSSVRTMELSQPHAMFSLTALSTRLVGGQCLSQVATVDCTGGQWASRRSLGSQPTPLFPLRNLDPMVFFLSLSLGGI